MSKYIIDKTTLAAIADAIRDKTLEKELLINETNNLNSTGEDGAYANTTIMFPGTTFLVTYNNQKYVCESYISQFGTYCIGNELIWKNRYEIPGEDSEFHYEDTPFLIVSEMNGNGLTLTPDLLFEWSEWYIETETENAEYTVKIEKLLSPFEPIAVKDFPAAIRAIDTAENLDAEIQEQKEKIAELETILANKASGGGAPVATCDVTVTIADDGFAQIDDIKSVQCTYIGLNEAGQMQSKNITLEVDDTVTLQCVPYTWFVASSNEVSGMWGETYYPQVTFDGTETFHNQGAVDTAVTLLYGDTDPLDFTIYLA